MLSTFSGLPRAAWIVFTGTVVNRLGYLVTPFLVFFLGSRGIPTEQIPYVLGALGAGNLVGPALGGLLADRVGRRSTMITGLVGTAAGQGLLFTAPDTATLALAAVLLSGAGSMVGPAASALLADQVTADRRRAAFSLFHWAVNIGTAVAGMLGGFLAARGYWLLFTVDVVSTLTYAVIAASFLPAGRPDRTRRAAGDGAGYGVVLRDPLMRALLPLFYIALVIYTFTEVALPLAIRDDGLSTTTLGLMSTLNAALVVVLQPVAITVLARFRQIPVYVAGSILVALGVALTGVADTPWAYAATVALWSLGEAVIGGVAGSIVAALAPDHARGRYQGAYQWTWGTARFTALSLGTTLYATAGPATLWWFSATAGTAAALGVGALSTAIGRRTSPDAAPAEKAAPQEAERTADAAA
ncbi:MFS transporter [Streptomyces mobaraensis NBRC 13819 = DSM 40847]|uniref:Major facilitator transporter n=1 Tax=Streptomyces mobaraensis (strain ATCC 29032 / DSM 40847 / JCM 4168 / NBRC 13819 / NCIMB 11159 / IPCR 16-22) TaxID=1223523 RepID=M3BB57_STRM1|nr:MFS transporter [Streptomyces mobaraensis]EME96789.1 major facilitator transporter [Streptomyces mobaraensis NBRC 13819 = DSM 40847]QTT74515.1 MFS transporter [Streptomyces mobaraensis NBRC 13819 = DSM 40847]